MELRRIARQKFDEAKTRQASGDVAGAAELLNAAAAIIRDMAEREVVQQDRVRLFQKANRAERMAADLARGRRVFNGKTTPDEASEAAADDYRASIDEVIHRSHATWADIGGIDDVKATLKYSMGLMLARMPHGLQLESASRILLYGPPGTGKTLLAAASSNMLGAVFFNVKASNLLSKYFGESTKLISALYSRARSEAETGAAVVFIDEFDAVCRTRNRWDETGAERRVLATLLAELDGLSEKGEPSRVITIAATNRPWDISNAILQRFEKHCFVDLPDEAAREAIFRIHVRGAGLELADDITFADLARRSDGFSGRNIQHACKDAVETMVREANRQVPAQVDNGTIRDYVINCRKLCTRDFETALSAVRPAATKKMLDRYRKWAGGVEAAV